jgi:shikimate dehydrogenase
MVQLPPISARTRYCAVWGHPVLHSASPPMQNAGIAALGLDWRYLAFDVRPNQLREALAGAKAMRWIGVNLTVPHKLLALDLMDELDESARRWGAVNTVRFEARAAGCAWRPLAEWPEEIPDDVRAVGFNTDAAALGRALQEDLSFSPEGATVLLLGAGGAGRMAALKLAAAGAARIYLVNRTRSKAEALAATLEQNAPGTAVSCDYPTAPAGVDLVLNATSLGLRPEDALPWDPARFNLRRARAVYDMVYRPAVTPLLAQGRAAGCRTANGLRMLLHQGADALELWSGRTAPRTDMGRALEENVYGPAFR